MLSRQEREGHGGWLSRLCRVILGPVAVRGGAWRAGLRRYVLGFWSCCVVKLCDLHDASHQFLTGDVSIIEAEVFSDGEQ